MKDLNKLPGNVKNKAKQKLVSASKNNSAVVLTTIMSGKCEYDGIYKDFVRIITSGLSRNYNNIQ